MNINPVALGESVDKIKTLAQYRDALNRLSTILSVISDDKVTEMFGLIVLIDEYETLLFEDNKTNWKTRY